MRKLPIAILVLALIAGGAWFWFGGFERVTQGRVRTALTDQGVPPQLADCMAGRMTEQLTITQLRSLERLAPEVGEAGLPLTIAEVLERARRVDDPQALEVTVRAAASCSLGFPL